MSSAPAKRIRDPRLDFFRGIAMFIIFIAHTPRDWWALWIPARFGFSDATEIFVFCSGMASAIAFGGVFATRGWWMGTARILHRIWQVYWAHIGLFFAVLTMMIAFDRFGLFHPEGWQGTYSGSLNLIPFLARPAEQIPGLFSLTYVPNYFDILPMYLVILALIPLMMALSRISVWAVAAVSIALWLVTNAKLFGAVPFNFPAEPFSERKWFFNPLGWQLVFFTGFAFMRGWISPPPVSRKLVVAAVAILVATVPFAWFRITGSVPEAKAVANAISPLTNKTAFGLFRYLHFLALAYVAWVAVGPLGARISNLGRAQIIVDVIRKVGQQSLAVFISSLVVAQFVGAVFRVYGTDALVSTLGNLGGFAALIAVAYGVAWFKGQPWRGPAPQTKSSGGAAVLPAGAPAEPSR